MPYLPLAFQIQGQKPCKQYQIAASQDNLPPKSPDPSARERKKKQYAKRQRTRTSQPDLPAILLLRKNSDQALSSVLDLDFGLVCLFGVFLRHGRQLLRGDEVVEGGVAAARDSAVVSGGEDGVAVYGCVLVGGHCWRGEGQGDGGGGLDDEYEKCLGIGWVRVVVVAS